MTRVSRLGWLIAVLVIGGLLLVGCGGDDQEATATATGAAADQGGAGGDADLVGTILFQYFGLGSEVLSDSEVACMNGELEAAFPEGVPSDASLTEEIGDALEAAAVTCDADLRQ